MVILHLPGPLYLLHRNWVTNNRVRSVVSLSVMYTYYPKRHRWSGSSRSTSSSSPPRRPTCAKWIPTRSGNDAASLDHERLLSVWTSNAKQPFSYTRKMRTVKIAYRSLFFLFSCFVVCGVGRPLGYPFGGLWDWETNVWDVRGHEGRRARLRIHVPDPVGSRRPVWLVSLCM